MKSNVSNMRLFGSKCWVKVPVEKTWGSHKLDACGISGIFLGYVNHGSAYKIFLEDSQEIVTAASVIFDETETGKPVIENVKQPGPKKAHFEDESNSDDEEDDDESEDGGGGDEDENWTTTGSGNGGASRVSSASRSSHDSTTPGPSSPPAVRQSTRERKAPREWWKSGHYAMAVESRDPVNFALLTMEEALDSPEQAKWMEAAKKELENV
ncbi:hypothetical protein HK100_007387, partial [Physocladia obscura]